MSQNEMFVKGLVFMSIGAMFIFLGAVILGLIGHYISKRKERLSNLS